MISSHLMPWIWGTTGFCNLCIYFKIFTLYKIKR